MVIPPPKTGYPQYSCALQICSNPSIFFPDATQSIKSTHARFNASTAKLVVKISGIRAGFLPTACFLWLRPTGFFQLGQQCLPPFSLVRVLPFQALSLPGRACLSLSRTSHHLARYFDHPVALTFNALDRLCPPDVSKNIQLSWNFSTIPSSRLSLYLLSALYLFTCSRLQVILHLEPEICCKRPRL